MCSISKNDFEVSLSDDDQSTGKNKPLFSLGEPYERLRQNSLGLERKKVFKVTPVQEHKEFLRRTCSSDQLNCDSAQGVEGFQSLPQGFITTSPHAAVLPVQALSGRPRSAVIDTAPTGQCTCQRELSRDINMVVVKPHKDNIIPYITPFKESKEPQYERLQCTTNICPQHPRGIYTPNETLNNTSNLTTTSEKSDIYPIITVQEPVTPTPLAYVPSCPVIGENHSSSTPLLTTHLPRGITLSSLHHYSLHNNSHKPNGDYPAYYLHVPSTPINHTTRSLNQLTVNSAKSIDLGCTDGRNLTITGAATNPAQLDWNDSVCNDDCGGSEGGSDSDVDLETPAFERIKWKNKVEYILTCLGSCVGLTNIWHFPYLCNKYGSVFLVPYTLMLLFCAAPLVLMELALGQYTRRGPATSLHNICPLFTGVGVSIVLLSTLSSWHQVISMAWSLVYFIRSFSPESWKALNLPLDNLCTNEVDDVEPSPYSLCVNLSISNSNTNDSMLKLMRSTSASWREEGVTLLTELQWEVVGAMVIVWGLLYISLWRSIRSSAKVVYFTATVPYIVLMLCLWRALSLRGASMGLQAFFTADWSLLWHYPMWVSAASHILHNCRIATGIMMVLASYKKFNTNVVSDAWIICLTSAGTSIIASVIVFSGLGNISLIKGINIYHLRAQGPELVFMMFPSAWSRVLNGKGIFWSASFFLLIFLTGFDTLMASLEVVITSLKDSFGEWIRNNIRHEPLFVLIVCLTIFLLGLPCIAQGGEFYFWLRDQDSYGVWASYLGLFQVIAVAGFYKVGKLTQNIREMTGKQPTFYFRICWWAVAPFVYVNLWVYSIINYTGLTAKPTGDVFHPLINETQENFHIISETEEIFTYPTWVQVYGWILFTCMIAPIPIFAVLIMIKSKGKTFLQKLKKCTTPRIRKCENCAKTVFGSAKTHNCIHHYSLKTVKLIHFKSKEENEEMNNTHTAVIFQPKDEISPVGQCQARKAIPDFDRNTDTLLSNNESIDT